MSLLPELKRSGVPLPPVPLRSTGGYSPYALAEQKSSFGAEERPSANVFQAKAATRLNDAKHQYVKCAGHATDLKGDENNVSESRKSRNDRNLKAESKGVTSDRGSEGSRRRKFVVTYRNRIKGLSSRVTGLQTRTPDSHSEGRGVNPAQQMERSVAYPGRPLRVPGNRIGRRVTAGRKA